VFPAARAPHAVAAVTLWAAHTHAFAAADASPRLAVMSAEPQSGKSRLLEVLKVVVRDPLLAVNISDAALFRVIASRTPTILHDEIDAVFGPKARDREDLRAMLNAGYERGAQVERCVGEGSKLMVKSFPVFAPVAMAGLGRLPDTVEQRCIRINMARRAPGEPADRFRKRTVAKVSGPLRDRLAEWADAHVDELATVEPDLPDALDDRAADIWEPLVAIADQAGGDWPKRARAAAVALFAARRDDESTIGTRLLVDIRDVFGDAAGFASGDLAGQLERLEGAPWADWTDKGFTPHSLAKLLRRYEIRPDQHRLGDWSFRGYLRDDFADAWSRYLSPTPVMDDEAASRASATTVATDAREPQQGQGLFQSRHLLHLPGEGTGEADDEDPGICPECRGPMKADGWCPICQPEHVDDDDPCARHHGFGDEKDDEGLAP
jgi:hypothetical protein